MSITVVEIYRALYFIFPAYCANAAPVIFGGGRPMDAGRTFLNGKPFLGSHKTIRGFFSGLLIGTLVGGVQHLLTPEEAPILLGFVLSLGALVGDLTESFIKRRLNLPPGSSLPVADQLDFVVGAVFFSFLVSPPPLSVLLIVLIITPPIHLLTNILAYLLGIKKNWW